MDFADFILYAFECIQSELKHALRDLSQEELTWRPGSEANSIGFVLWHLLRCEDAVVSDWILHETQLWIAEQWCNKLNLSDDPDDNGYGYTAEQVAAFPVPQLSDLLSYGEAVRARTVEYLRSEAGNRLDEVVQTQDLGELRIGQVFSIMLCETAVHVGQIAFLRGLQRGINA